MSRRQSLRKEREGRPPNLRLVPDPPPKARPRRRRRWKIGRIRKPKYGQNPVLLAYEEELVIGAISGLGGHASHSTLMATGRFRRVELWQTLLRLRRQQRLLAAMSLSATYAKTPTWPRSQITFQIPPEVTHVLDRTTD